MKRLRIGDHCRHGHLLDEANTYIYKGYHHVCRTCHRQQAAKHRAKRPKKPRYRKQPTDPIPRFWARIEKTTTCWVWTGTRSKSGGYGILSVNGKYVRAHRFSFELHKAPIGPNMEACHTCDNPPCVNPDHLFEGTHRDNMLDMKRKQRGLFKEKTQTDIMEGIIK